MLRIHMLDTDLVIANDELDDGIAGTVLGEGSGMVVRENNGVQGRLRLELGLRLHGLLRKLGLLPFGDCFFLLRDVILQAILTILGIMNRGDMAAKA